MIKINRNNFLLIAVIFLFFLRGFLNAYLPLMDKTEARYAEISRMMVETNNWVTPQIDYNTPFWAKPPLSTWLSALSMKLFGVNEFAVRLPSLLLSLLLVLLMKYFVKSKFAFYLLGFILMTTPEFLLHAGVVSTDTTLAFCITMIFLSFWKAVTESSSRLWGYLIFAFIGLGLLAKGPIVLILTIPPIFIWTIYFKEYKLVFKRIPWFIGTILSLVIAVPWYIMAEQRTEGFLEYFVIGEHFKRFFDSSWKGDKYGFPKSQPFGMVWVFLLGFAFPWIQILIKRLWISRRNVIKDKWILFLMLWLCWLPVFFTSSKSLIHTYILPVMVPVALLIKQYWEAIKIKKAVLISSCILPVLAVVIIIVSLFNRNLETYSNTDKYLILSTNKTDSNLYYFGEKSYSSQFYSNGQVKGILNEELIKKIEDKEQFRIIIPNRRLKTIDQSIMHKLVVMDSSYKTKIYKHINN
ncbi:ArnT family glycosyltransferase [Seonamhaeicola marinus]|uniref:Glycosyltransferase family 39 protein n=1 Tax=Seonamhaeicola marinus TaxID=1912246 RepID=A0A5D0I756_9FLAO|nr:glycosyltransferase family 39 protein [Seonamhaeicola marinus]TYA78731.1 glycosyltransferase family 39 protein [Seonamhaeicola marinus]